MPPSLLLGYILYIDQSVCYGVNNQSGSGMDLQFIGYVAAMSCHRMYREKQKIGYFLVIHSFGDAYDNILLPVAEYLQFILVGCFIFGLVDIGNLSALSYLLLYVPYCRYKQFIFNHAM